MKVGTICKLKVDCLGNKAGTLGVVYDVFVLGTQVIFENGLYEEFSTHDLGTGIGNEEERYLEEIGFEESLAGYKFQNVKTVCEDYRQGKFDIAWSEGWKTHDILRTHKFGTEKLAEYLSQPKESEYEKCEVYADGNRPAWLRFKRKRWEGEGGFQSGAFSVCMLSAAMDYEDFSHFEYAEIGMCIEPRLFLNNNNLYPKYVVFRKKLRQERKCRKCGCTDLHACPGPCYWVEDDLCSECAPSGARGKTAGSTGMNDEAQS